MLWQESIMSVFLEISVVLTITTLVAFLMRRLRQPLVVGYILTGIIVGPSVLNLITAQDTIELFAKFGITILLFIVGLYLNPQVIKEVGSVSAVTGVGQVLFTSLVGFGIATFLGIDRVAAFYVAIALTFSSTIIILKLLSDKGDVQSLYGKIAIGFLLVQDIIATVILIVVSSFAGAGDLPLATVLSLTAAKGLLLLLIIVAFSQYILPKLMASVGKNHELLFLFSITWGLGFAGLFYVLGLSIEIGALIAGVALSPTAYATEIASRLRPLRDFFITLFFIMLGASMIISLDSAILIPTIVLSLFVLIGNPIIVIVLMNILGYHRKTGFMAGLTVAQISEFSLILAALGLQIGHISAEILTIITWVGVITIAGSTYLILYSHRIYPLTDKLLQFLELKKSDKSPHQRKRKLSVFLFGYHRVGAELLNYFKEQGFKVGVVDFDPQTPARLPKNYPHYFYGDAGSVEFLEELPTQHAKLVISTIPSYEANRTLLDYFKHHQPELGLVIFAENKKEAQALYKAGADYVVVPYYAGAEWLTKLLNKINLDIDKLAPHRRDHQAELEAKLG